MTTKKTSKNTPKTATKPARSKLPKKSKDTYVKPAKEARSNLPKKSTKKPTETPKDLTKIIVKILNILVYSLGIFIIACYGILFAFQISWKNGSSFLGYYLFHVGSGSMEPALNIGEEIIIKETDEFEVGDIVTYSAEGGNFVTHRVTAINGDQIITKGDDNNVEDDPVLRSDVIGKYTSRATILSFVMKYKVPILAVVGVLILAILILRRH